MFTEQRTVHNSPGELASRIQRGEWQEIRRGLKMEKIKCQANVPYLVGKSKPAKLEGQAVVFELEGEAHEMCGRNSISDYLLLAIHLLN